MLLERANPFAIAEIPDPRSPAAEALYERIAGRVDVDRPNCTGRRWPDAPRRQWLRRRVAVAAVVAAVIAGVGALLPARMGDGRASALERALAAVSSGPVIHALVENAESRAILVDLASGAESVEPERYEYWYDEDRGELLARLTIGTEVLHEIHMRPRSGPPLLRELAFATGYRDALETGEARLVRWESVSGRRAPVLSIEVPPWRDPRTNQVVQPGFTEEVVVDPDTYEPLRFRHIPGPDVVSGPVAWWRVLSIESGERDDRDFASASPPRPWTQFAPSNDREVTVGEAATALGRGGAVWPGTEIDGVALERIGVVTTAITWTDGRETKSPSLLIRYEDPRDRRRWLWLSVGTSPEETPRFGPVDGESVPLGKVRLMQTRAADDRSIDMWFGNVELADLYINIQSPQRELIVAAVRKLRPLD